MLGRSLMGLLTITFGVMLAGHPPALAQQSVWCNQIGDATLCSDSAGNTSSSYQIGNQRFGSDSQGHSWNSVDIGSSTFGSDSAGNTWNSFQSGNLGFGSDSAGNTWNTYQFGNSAIINGPNRRQTYCYRIGQQIVCNRY